MRYMLYALVSLLSLAFSLMNPKSAGDIEAHSVAVPQATMALVAQTTP